MSGLSSFIKYTTLKLAEKANGQEPIKSVSLWAAGKPQTFIDRMGEAMFGKIIWTWWKCREKGKGDTP